MSDDAPKAQLVSRARALSMVRTLKAAAASLLAEGKNPRAASRALRDKHGMSRRTADRYVAAALAEMCRDALDEPMESKRARTIAKLEHLHDLALKRTRDTQDGGERADPDVKTAASVTWMQAQLDGVTAPTLRDGPPKGKG